MTEPQAKTNYRRLSTEPTTAFSFRHVRARSRPFGNTLRADSSHTKEATSRSRVTRADSTCHRYRTVPTTPTVSTDPLSHVRLRSAPPATPSQCASLSASRAAERLRRVGMTLTSYRTWAGGANTDIFISRLEQLMATLRKFNYSCTGCENTECVDLDIDSLETRPLSSVRIGDIDQKTACPDCGSPFRRVRGKTHRQYRF